MVFGEDIQISIQDEGIGIPSDDLTKIFSLYYRTNNGKTKAKGMGVGLFISKEIVEAHSGKIWVESEPGKGSIFFVSIPLDAQLMDKHKAG